MRRVTLQAGEYVYKVDDPSTSIYVVRSGKVELTTPYPETGEGVEQSHGPGHVFGEVEVIDGRSRTTNARVVAVSDLMQIEREELMDILYTHPEKSLILGKSSFERLRELFSEESLESELARLREEMQLSIREAVVAHESRVVKSHNGMAAIGVPIVLMVALAVGSYWFFHRG
ncbi:cyclic nucleotide-binding domain-containing protein [Vulcanococcus limneticus]|uniref:cyclic nucleotide-binding domain-containing protein n=1 Tax=Vulcanococcus limneticus TaxID=2170428 RepID=UPI000B984361|nr:cyclic nucleotide-binding domain-containing protein [Vulcanococcus limneticus]MCP9792984.1 cyclic nucleotide-binding domain-containing protein [Vulcanococcus limneticus MW73D5]MCP9894989.1 cyclic nucleotide-binding domain-containing protein [Vulcanococcus limneticus Candia 3F8]MCP9898377.1 cyclic nucleotide-binding domain-containing protein [Vulcanococcus limneticus Candia 3B3]